MIRAACVATAVLAVTGLGRPAPVRAQSVAGTLDASFGTGGKYVSDLGGSSMFGPGVGVQVDGRIVVGGEGSNGADTDFATLRLTRAGVLDPAFGSGGVASQGAAGRSEDAKSVVILGDGRILVGGEGGTRGYGQHAAYRYNTDGTLDRTFGASGLAGVDFGRASHLHAMAVQADGRIVMAGESYASESNNTMALARVDANGVLDTTFGSNGRVQQSLGDATNAHSVAVASDGKIVAGGYVVNATGGAASACFVARFQSNGSADTSFGTGGATLVTATGYTLYCHKVLLQSDGKILLVGSRLRGGIGDFMVVRFTTSGTLDPDFGTGGVVTTEFGGRLPSSAEEASAGALQPDGRIVAGGYSENKFALARYLSNGTLDTSFGTGGKVTFAMGTDDTIKSIALAPDGAIVAAGIAKVGSTYRMAVARLLNDAGTGLSDSDRLFNWAEWYAPQYFSPRGAVTQTVQGYTARLYANGNAIGTRDGHLFVYGTVFGGLRDMGVLTSYLAQAIAAGY